MSGEKTHHAAPIRAIKVRGVDFVAVDDMAAMFAEMAQAMPEAKLGQVLGQLVEAIGARPQESMSDPPSTAGRPGLLQPPPRRSRLHAPSPAVRRAAALAVPLLLVNGWAVYGQAAWAYDHLLPSRVAAVAFAATVESIAVYLAYEARTALLAGDSSFRLRIASYVAALAAGAMNYSHYAPAWGEPNAAALIFAVLSALSPWLWAIRTRSQRRDQLRQLGLVDGRAAHFSAARWLHFPRRTWRALRWSIDHGEQDPAKAWGASRPAKAASNGHGKTNLERAIEHRIAFEAENGRRPTQKELAALAGVHQSTARDALALTREK